MSDDPIEAMFEHTRALHAQQKASFDIDDTCRWSYFFVDPSRDALESAARELARMGYERHSILEPDPDDPEDEMYLLRVDRIETHTAASLRVRGDELESWAEERGLEGYDGMEVGDVDTQ